jgi:hypothetical protein
MESRMPLAYIKPIEYKRNSWCGMWRISERRVENGFRLKGLEENQ